MKGVPPDSLKTLTYGNPEKGVERVQGEVERPAHLTYGIPKRELKVKEILSEGGFESRIPKRELKATTDDGNDGFLKMESRKGS